MLLELWGSNPSQIYPRLQAIVDVLAQAISVLLCPYVLCAYVGDVAMEYTLLFSFLNDDDHKSRPWREIMFQIGGFTKVLGECFKKT